MLKAFFLIFYFGSIVCTFPPFKFIKFENGKWKIFKRLGDESCSFYEEIFEDGAGDHFLTVKNGFMRLGHRKELTGNLDLENPDCLEGVGFKKIMYSKQIGTNFWIDKHNKTVDVEDYDVEACKKHENFTFHGLELSDTENEITDDVDCIDHVLRSLSHGLQDEFLLITDFDECQFGYMVLEDHTVSLGKV